MPRETPKHAFDRQLKATEQVTVDVQRINSVDFPELNDAHANQWIQSLCRMYTVDDDRSTIIGYHAERKHGRSGVVPNLKLVDARGLAWEVSVKGMGNMHSSSTITGTATLKPTAWHAHLGARTVYGLADAEAAEHSWNMYDALAPLGVRTTIPIAYALAETLLVENIQTPVAGMPRYTKASNAAKSTRYHLVGDQQPVFDVEAFRIKTRHDQITSSYHSRFEGREEYVREQIALAIQLVMEEMGLSEMSVETYCKWFTDSLGESLGRMHAGGYVYRNLYSNVTLDCRLPDRDTVRSFHDLRVEHQAILELDKEPEGAAQRVEWEEMHQDLQFVRYLIDFVYVVYKAHGLNPIIRRRIARRFQESYARAYCERMHRDFEIPDHAFFSDDELVLG